MNRISSEFYSIDKFLLRRIVNCYVVQLVDVPCSANWSVVISNPTRTNWIFFRNFSVAIFLFLQQICNYELHASPKSDITLGLLFEKQKHPQNRYLFVLKGIFKLRQLSVRFIKCFSRKFCFNIYIQNFSNFRSSFGHTFSELTVHSLKFCAFLFQQFRWCWLKFFKIFVLKRWRLLEILK